MQLNLPGIFFTQGANGGHIIRKLIHGHAHMADKIAPVRPWRMIRKAQHVKACGNGRLYKGFILTESVLASGGVRVIITFQGNTRFFL